MDWLVPLFVVALQDSGLLLDKGKELNTAAFVTMARGSFVSLAILIEWIVLLLFCCKASLASNAEAEALLRWKDSLGSIPASLSNTGWARLLSTFHTTIKILIQPTTSKVAREGFLMEIFSIFVKLHEDCSFLVRKETKAANPTLFPTELPLFFPFQEYSEGINSVNELPL